MENASKQFESAYAHVFRLPRPAFLSKKGACKKMLHDFIPEKKYAVRIRDVRVARDLHDRYILGEVIKLYMVCRRGQSCQRILDIRDDTGVACLMLCDRYALETSVISERDYVLISGMNVDCVSRDAAIEPLQLSASPQSEVLFQLSFIPSFKQSSSGSEVSYSSLSEAKSCIGKAVNIFGLALPTIREGAADSNGDKEHHMTLKPFLQQFSLQKAQSQNTEKNICHSLILTLMDKSVADESDQLSGFLPVKYKGKSDFQLPPVGSVVRIHNLWISRSKTFVFGTFNDPGWLCSFVSMPDDRVAICTSSPFLRMQAHEWHRVDKLLALATETFVNDINCEEVDECKLQIADDRQLKRDQNEIQNRQSSNASAMSPPKSRVLVVPRVLPLVNGAKFLNVTYMTLSMVDTEMFFNAYCQIISWSVVKPGVAVLWIYDGTKINGVLQNDSLQLSKAAVHGDPLLKELAVKVFIYDNHVSSLQQVTPGSFASILDIHAHVQFDAVHNVSVWKFELHGSGSKFQRGIYPCDATSSIRQPLLPSRTNKNDEKTFASKGALNDFDALYERNAGAIATGYQKSIATKQIKTDNAKCNNKDVLKENLKVSSAFEETVCSDDNPAAINLGDCVSDVKQLLTCNTEIDQQSDEAQHNSNVIAVEDVTHCHPEKQNDEDSSQPECQIFTHHSANVSTTVQMWQSLKIISEPVCNLSHKPMLSSVNHILNAPCNSAFRVKAAILDVGPTCDHIMDLVRWSCHNCMILLSHSEVAAMNPYDVHRYFCKCRLEDGNILQRGVLYPVFVLTLLVCDQYMQSLEVTVQGDDAVAFFNDITATAFLDDKNIVNRLREIVKNMCEHSGRFDGDTKRLHCFIHKHDTLSSQGIQYKVISTKLLP